MNIPEKFWKAAAWALCLLAIFLVVISIKEIKAIGYVGVNPQGPNTITVSGTGDAMAAPDVATFSFTVTETKTTVADAQKAATDKINSALKAVRDAGVADKDIQTESYYINPHYEYQSESCVYTSGAGSGTSSSGGTIVPLVSPSLPPVPICRPGRNVLTGYDVSQSIQVKVRELGKAGAIFTSIGSLGVESVNGLTFSVDNPDSVQAEARTKAIADAQSKAKELAKELGVRLVRITSFSDNNYSPRPMMYAMGAAVGSESSKDVTPPEVPAGEQKMTDTVSITYEIE
jgi:hypothetical protein